MKRLILLLTIFFVSTSAFAQTKTESTPIYLKFPTIPAFTINKIPTGTPFTKGNLEKGKKMLFMIFSPECGHCQQTTDMMVRNIDKLKDVQIVMVSYFPQNEIKSFYTQFGLNRFSNITVGQDTKYFFPSFYNVKFFPSFYIYDAKGNFKKFLEGSITMEKLQEALNS